jgi:opacity protein-like surface antigen
MKRTHKKPSDKILMNMKYFTSLLLFACFALTVKGQNHFIGIKGGYGLTNISSNVNYSDQKTQPGFVVGFTYNFVTKRKFSFGADFTYDRRGFALEREIDRETILGTFLYPNQYNYFSLPLKLGYNFGNTFFGYTNIGVSPSLLHKAAAITPNFKIMQSPSGEYYRVLISKQKKDISKGVQKFDVSGLVEIGCGYKISKRCIVVTSFSSQYSFTTFLKFRSPEDGYTRHYGMTGSLGIRYNLTNK